MFVSGDVSGCQRTCCFVFCGGRSMFGLNIFRHHLDGTAGTLGGADAATLAVVVVEREAPARAELDHGIVWTDALAVVALEAVAAAHAAPRLEYRGLLVDVADDFSEARRAANDVEHRADGSRRIRVVAGVHLPAIGDVGLRLRRGLLAAQEGVAIARRLLAEADGGRDVALH